MSDVSHMLEFAGVREALERAESERVRAQRRAAGKEAAAAPSRASSARRGVRRSGGTVVTPPDGVLSSGSGVRVSAALAPTQSPSIGGGAKQPAGSSAGPSPEPPPGTGKGVAPPGSAPLPLSGVTFGTSGPGGGSGADSVDVSGQLVVIAGGVLAFTGTPAGSGEPGGTGPPAGGAADAGKSEDPCECCECVCECKPVITLRDCEVATVPRGKATLPGAVMPSDVPRGGGSALATTLPDVTSAPGTTAIPSKSTGTAVDQGVTTFPIAISGNSTTTQVMASVEPQEYGLSSGSVPGGSFAAGEQMAAGGRPSSDPQGRPSDPPPEPINMPLQWWHLEEEERKRKEQEKKDEEERRKKADDTGGGGKGKGAVGALKDLGLEERAQDRPGKDGGSAGDSPEPGTTTGTGGSPVTADAPSRPQAHATSAAQPAGASSSSPAGSEPPGPLERVVAPYLSLRRGRYRIVGEQDDDDADGTADEIEAPEALASSISHPEVSMFRAHAIAAPVETGIAERRDRWSSRATPLVVPDPAHVPIGMGPAGTAGPGRMTLPMGTTTVRPPAMQPRLSDRRAGAGLGAIGHRPLGPGFGSPLGLAGAASRPGGTSAARFGTGGLSSFIASGAPGGAQRTAGTGSGRTGPSPAPSPWLPRVDFDPERYAAELRQSLGRNALPGLDSIMGALAPPRFMPSSGGASGSGSSGLWSKGTEAPSGSSAGAAASVGTAVARRVSATGYSEAVPQRASPRPRALDRAGGLGSLSHMRGEAPKAPSVRRAPASSLSLTSSTASPPPLAAHRSPDASQSRTDGAAQVGPDDRTGASPSPSSGPAARPDLMQDIASRNPSARLGRGRSGGTPVVVAPVEIVEDLPPYGGPTRPKAPQEPLPQPGPTPQAAPARRTLEDSRSEARDQRRFDQEVHHQYSRALHGSEGARVEAVRLLGQVVGEALDAAANGDAARRSADATDWANLLAEIDTDGMSPKDAATLRKDQRTAVRAAIKAGREANKEAKKQIAKALDAAKKALRVLPRGDDSGARGALEAAISEGEAADNLLAAAEEMEALAASALDAGDEKAANQLHGMADELRQAAAARLLEFWKKYLQALGLVIGGKEAHGKIAAVPAVEPNLASYADDAEAGEGDTSAGCEGSPCESKSGCAEDCRAKDEVCVCTWQKKKKPDGESEPEPDEDEEDGGTGGGEEAGSGGGVGLPGWVPGGAYYAPDPNALDDEEGKQGGAEETTPSDGAGKRRSGKGSNEPTAQDYREQVLEILDGIISSMPNATRPKGGWREKAESDPLVITTIADILHETRQLKDPLSRHTDFEDDAHWANIDANTAALKIYLATMEWGGATPEPNFMERFFDPSSSGERANYEVRMQFVRQSVGRWTNELNGALTRISAYDRARVDRDLPPGSELRRNSDKIRAQRGFDDAYYAGMAQVARSPLLVKVIDAQEDRLAGTAAYTNYKSVSAAVERQTSVYRRRSKTEEEYHRSSGGEYELKAFGRGLFVALVVVAVLGTGGWAAAGAGAVLEGVGAGSALTFLGSLTAAAVASELTRQAAVDYGAREFGFDRKALDRETQIALVATGVAVAGRDLAKYAADRVRVRVQVPVQPGGGAAVVAEGSGSRLVHLTSKASEAEILASRELRGARGIFALEREVAEGAGTAERVLRTGLSPDQTKALVGIPEAASGQFTRPWAIGPYSAWKRFGGVHFSKPGTIVLGPEGAAGTFLPSSSLLGPRTLIYGPDIAGYTMAGGVGVYLWTQDSRK